MKILLADDNSASRGALEDHLRGWECEVVTAASGERALEILQGDGEVSLLIAALELPGMDGVELCRRARTLDRRRYLHTVLLTEKTATHDLLDLVTRGVDAVFPDPIHPPQLLAQIRVADRIQTLEDRLSERVEELTKMQRRTREDLEAAAKVQKSLLPRDRLSLPGVDVFWIYEACELVAGDMFHVHRLDESRLGLYILDVSGHGVKAALLAVTLSRLLTPHTQAGGLLKRSLSRAPFYEIVSPGEVARECNEIFPMLGDSNFFCTLLYGILDMAGKRFTYVRAGHPGPILSRGAGVTLLEDKAGPAIGVTANQEFPESTIELVAGDKLVLFSDGVDEALNAEGETFGRERLIDVLADCHLEGIEATLEAVVRELRGFVRGEVQNDDITLLGIGVK